MPTIKDTPHVHARDEIARFNAATSIHRVFARLGEMGRSGFVMEQGGRPVAYVDAHELARVIGREAQRRKRLPKFGRRPVSDFMPALPDEALIPIRSAPVPLDELTAHLEKEPGSGFAVVEGKRQVGWYLQREWFSGTHTRRVRFICPNNHINYDPDSTYRCWTCSLPLRRVEQE